MQQYIEVKGPITNLFSYPLKAGNFVLEIHNIDTIKILDQNTGEIVPFVSPDKTNCKRNKCVFDEEN